MRLLILSDLHLEHWRGDEPTSNLAISEPDVVILAGDIHNGDRAVAWAAERFAGLPVLYVMGNHESYGANLEHVQRDIVIAASLTSNVHYLDCGEFIIGNVRFIGTTLWTDFQLFGSPLRALAMTETEKALNDYRLIRLAEQGYRKLRAADTAQFHSSQRRWLSDKLSEPFNGKTVVITHMCPSMRSVAERYAEDFVSAGFASNLDVLVEQSDLWVHGHTHDSFDYHIGKCRVVCNPCGYQTGGGYAENANFDPDFIVELHFDAVET